MKYKYASILLTLLFTSSLWAQSTNTNVVAWRAAEVAEGTNWNPGTSSQALQIVQNILSLPQISNEELGLLERHYKAVGGKDLWHAQFPALSTNSLYAAAQLKAWNKNLSGWTQEMVASNPTAASDASMLPGAPAQLKTWTWDVISARQLRNPREIRFFKQYRATLPVQQQLQATALQKAALVAKVNRTEAENAWLAEVSADLIALSLDQQQ